MTIGIRLSTPQTHGLKILKCAMKTIGERLIDRRATVGKALEQCKRDEKNRHCRIACIRLTRCAKRRLNYCNDLRFVSLHTRKLVQWTKTIHSLLPPIYQSSHQQQSRMFRVGSRHDRCAGLEGGTSLERRRFAADLPSSAPLSTEGTARPDSCLV